MDKKSFVELIEESIRKNWNINALSDYRGLTYKYSDVAEKIKKIHYAFIESGIVKGDKVALVGKNSANWGVIYLATVTYGAVIVPILPDFLPDDMVHLVNHSDSKVLFAEESIFVKLDTAKFDALQLVIEVKDLSVLHTFDQEAKKAIEESQRKYFNDFKDGLKPSDVKYNVPGKEDLAVISYTSGTTGFSKGVMVPHRSLSGNMHFARANMPLLADDKIVSFLPLAHTYGCAFEFLFPFTIGCDITFLTKSPTPTIVTDAFRDKNPALILSVPLVIEKIFKVKIMPVLNKGSVKVLIKIPLLNKIIYNKIKKSLLESFGGNMNELVIGGAAFNPEAEAFFRKIKFPFTVGYGMTECGPLISYASWKTTCLGGSGKSVDELTVKIDSDDPENKAGEIILKGSHLMQGYYKNEDATKQVIDKDGWFHTGDLGLIDHAGNILIKGRSKSMILGASGKNIYPEELESVLNNRPLVQESLVVYRNSQLVALICPDKDAVKKLGVKNEDLKTEFAQYVKSTNSKFPSYMQIAHFEVYPEEFIKTPKRSIKRFMYK